MIPAAPVCTTIMPHMVRPRVAARHIRASPRTVMGGRFQWGAGKGTNAPAESSPGPCRLPRCSLQAGKPESYFGGSFPHRLMVGLPHYPWFNQGWRPKFFTRFRSHHQYKYTVGTGSIGHADHRALSHATPPASVAPAPHNTCLSPWPSNLRSPQTHSNMNCTPSRW